MTNETKAIQEEARIATEALSAEKDAISKELEEEKLRVEEMKSRY